MVLNHLKITNDLMAYLEEQEWKLWANKFTALGNVIIEIDRNYVVNHLNQTRDHISELCAMYFSSV